MGSLGCVAWGEGLVLTEFKSEVVSDVFSDFCSGVNYPVRC